MLSLPFAAYAAPQITFFDIHPASLVLVVCYGLGVVATARLRANPMWEPVDTEETRADIAGDDDSPDKPACGLIVQFVALMCVMGAAGWVIAMVGAQVTDRLGLSASLVGCRVVINCGSLRVDGSPASFVDLNCESQTHPALTD